VIAWRGVTAGSFRDASFAVAPGTVTKILTLSDTDTDLLVRLITGAERPESGDVLLFGEELGATPEARVRELLRRVGLVWRGGGFVSNLKVWENILLPLWYHGGARGAPPGLETVALELLARLGVEGERLPHFLQSLPGTLGTRDRRLLAIVRAFLQEPELLLYVDVGEGLDAAARERILETARWYHGRTAGRTTVLLADNELSLAGMPADVVLRQGNDGRIVA
jgi:phospholipid/cholesterol/gamma-HCH transport system ATP-binding protein